MTLLLPLLAPLYNRILDKVPNRLATALATVLSSGSIIVAAFCPNYFSFVAAYTIFAGVGLGISVVRVVAITAEYFEAYRVLALAWSSSGAGLGVFVYSRLGAYMIETYTWRVALIGFGLIHLNVIPLCLCLRQLPMDPIAQPFVVVPDHPDLSNISQTNVKVASSVDLCTSLFSINNASFGSKSVYSRRRTSQVMHRSLPSHQLRVVIEFAQVNRDNSTRSTLTFKPVSFLNELSTSLLFKIEEAAKKRLLEASQIHGSVLVPLIFVVGRMLTRSDGGEEITPSIVFDSDITQSRIMSGQQSLVHDTFVSSAVTAHERRQLRQGARAFLRQAVEHVQKLADVLSARGVCVHSDPILAVIELDDLNFPTELTEDEKSGGDCRFLYFGPAEKAVATTSEEKGDLYNFEDLAMSTDNVVKQQSFVRKIRKPSNFTASQSSISGRPTRLSSVYRSHISIPARGGLRKFSEEDLCDQNTTHAPRSLRPSVVSFTSSPDAVNLIAETLERTANPPEPEDFTAAFNKNLFLDVWFVTFLLSRSLSCIADSIFYAHLTSYADSLGFRSTEATDLLSFAGMAGMIGRILVGLVGQFVHKIEIGSLAAICLLSVGVLMIVTPLLTTYPALATFAISYGILVSPGFAFAPSLAFRILGKLRYDKGMSFIFQFCALGVLFGGPTGGKIEEATGSFAQTFIFAGASNLGSGIIIGIQAALKSRKLGRCRRLASTVLQRNPENSEDGKNLKSRAHNSPKTDVLSR
ncbi:unnamed protein product [Calicophoron daubneyi]|uniref:Major facilitator superfamily (MFS) profile domain-containing protein n=1 Tax=Calicophoron daubneyi TaxID=300641 RepID=A0AAV2TAN9_CALDB